MDQANSSLISSPNCNVNFIQFDTFITYGKAEDIIQKEFEKLDVQEKKGWFTVIVPDEGVEINYDKIKKGYVFNIKHGPLLEMMEKLGTQKKNTLKRVANKYFKNPKFSYENL